MEIGLVKKVWDELCLWVLDQERELLSEGEIEAWQMAALANQMYEESTREQERLNRDVAFRLKADMGSLKQLQQQLKRARDETDKSDLLHRVNLIKKIVAAKQKQLDDGKQEQLQNTMRVQKCSEQARS
jgi:hypothetical protein